MHIILLHNLIIKTMSSTFSDTHDDQNIEESQETKRGRKELHVWDHFFKESLGRRHYSVKCNYCNQK